MAPKHRLLAVEEREEELLLSSKNSLSLTIIDTSLVSRLDVGRADLASPLGVAGLETARLVGGRPVEVEQPFLNIKLEQEIDRFVMDGLEVDTTKSRSIFDGWF